MKSLGAALVRAAQSKAKAPVPYSPRWRADPVTAVWPGTTRQMHAMDGVGTLFAIVDGLAENVSMSEWKLWRKSASGKPEDRVEVTDHLALKVLNNPTPFMTRQELFEALQQHYELVGVTLGDGGAATVVSSSEMAADTGAAHESNKAYEAFLLSLDVQ